MASQPMLAFTIELMEIARMLVLECHASLYDIVAFMKATAIKQLQVRFMYMCMYACLYSFLYIPMIHAENFNLYGTKMYTSSSHQHFQI